MRKLNDNLKKLNDKRDCFHADFYQYIVSNAALNQNQLLLASYNSFSLDLTFFLIIS